MPTPFWGTPEVRNALKTLDRGGFALEFLRRNPDYGAGRRRAARETPHDDPDVRARLDRHAGQWGLFFRP